MNILIHLVLGKNSLILFWCLMQFFFCIFYTCKAFCGVEAIGGPAEQSTAGGAFDDEEDDRIGKLGMSGFVEL